MILGFFYVIVGIFGKKWGSVERGVDRWATSCPLLSSLFIYLYGPYQTQRAQYGPCKYMGHIVDTDLIVWPIFIFLIYFTGAIWAIYNYNIKWYGPYTKKGLWTI